MKKVVCAALIAAGVSGLVLAQDRLAARGEVDTELVFFFSDRTADLESAARALRAIHDKNPSLRIRPVYLAEDFKSLGEPTAEFAAGIKELKYTVGDGFSIRVYDDSGLALARQLKLERVPAFALISSRGERQRAFVAYGIRANLEELLKCAK